MGRMSLNYLKHTKFNHFFSVYFRLSNFSNFNDFTPHTLADPEYLFFFFKSRRSLRNARKNHTNWLLLVFCLFVDRPMRITKKRLSSLNALPYNFTLNLFHVGLSLFTSLARGASQRCWTIILFYSRDCMCVCVSVPERSFVRPSVWLRCLWYVVSHSVHSTIYTHDVQPLNIKVEAHSIRIHL